ncbi:MAG TPA: zf-HC2 domain-containing protein [Bacteroidota bacterium]|nr:zf-HC2 domain-containing protein [Bacteroidota bacterium]
MNCHRFRNTLYLYRTRELSNREAEELVQHLHTCESCRLEHERIARVDRAVSRLRSFEPTVDAPDELTGTIMTRIRTSGTGTSGDFLERLLELFTLRSVRLASASVIVLATGVFLFQYYTLFSGIHALESSAGSESSASSRTATLYAVPSSSAVELAQSKDIQKLIPPGQFRVVGGQILVPQHNVSSLLSTYNLRAITSLVASSVLRIDRTKAETIIQDVSKNYRSVTGFVQ